MKRCSRCKRVEPRVQFAQRRDGTYFSTCMDCRTTRKVGTKNHGDLVSFLIELEGVRAEVRRASTPENPYADVDVGVAIYRLKRRLGLL